mgnify:CR=1 FL=1
MKIDVETFDGGRAARIHPSGRIDVHSVDGLYETFGELVDEPAIERVIVDFSAIEELDSSAIAAFSVGIDELREAGKQLRAENMTRDQRSALDLMPRYTGGAAGPTDDSHGWFEYVGENAYATFEEFSAFYNVLTDTVYSALGLLWGKLPPKGSVTEQAVRVGVNSLPIIGLLSFLLGLILAFQSAHQLRQFGANIYVANLVSISMVREFGPMMTGILLAGRSGSSMAAELGTMKISEEVDALNTMGIDSTRFLILPRMIAISLVQPALTLMSMFIGIFGGFIIARLYLDVSASIYINKSIEALQMGDLFHGLVKSLVFAWLIGVISCFSGMTVQKGSSGVGRATTRAVVISIFMIIVADSIFTTSATLLN